MTLKGSYKDTCLRHKSIIRPLRKLFNSSGPYNALQGLKALKGLVRSRKALRGLIRLLKVL